MKARIKENLVDVIDTYFAGSESHRTDEGFLALADRIAGKVVELVFHNGDTQGDAFEKEDGNYWLPDVCWDEVPDDTPVDGKSVDEFVTKIVENNEFCCPKCKSDLWHVPGNPECMERQIVRLTEENERLKKIETRAGELRDKLDELYCRELGCNLESDCTGDLGHLVDEFNDLVPGSSPLTIHDLTEVCGHRVLAVRRGDVGTIGDPKGAHCHAVEFAVDLPEGTETVALILSTQKGGS